jgi:RNA polymerase sigma-70 factor (ECF subfamily)
MEPAKACPDDVLVERARARDEAAFRELVHRHHPTLRRLVSRIVKVNLDQDEVMQNVLLSAWRNLPRFQGRARFASWMYRLTVNAALMVRRAQKRMRYAPLEALDERKRHLLETDGYSICPPGTCWIERPDQAMQRSELRALLQEKVMDLSSPLREVLLLRYVEGLSVKECTRYLHLSESAVKTRLHRACAQLRAAIHRDEAALAVCPQRRARPRAGAEKPRSA